MENMKDGIENIKITKNDTSERCPECGQEFINKILSYYVEFVANGGFGSVYKAIWQDGPIEEPFWNIKKSEWNRNSFKEVAIKKFRNATSVSLEFLKEVRSNLMLNYSTHSLDICRGERPLIPEYTPEPYAALMKCCWDPIPTNRPSANELLVQTGNWEKIIYKFEFSDSQLTEEFSQEREEKWKARLAELAINPHPLKISQNMLTSKRLYYSKQLTQLLETDDVEMKTNVYHTRQFDMSL
ncbi:unnamed protein product [Rhizophagus irregularis]|uniref:Serine-threonine/tyrosine-protein kinase catalytic domain-containing protein n=1 Tax=Rhizophagus irregularis TaxID=588596 RepID=A0A915ZV88_9GLOM|nr:unnamed protein product [Rhizophagus irregularis]